MKGTSASTALPPVRLTSASTVSSSMDAAAGSSSTCCEEPTCSSVTRSLVRACALGPMSRFHFARANKTTAGVLGCANTCMAIRPVVGSIKPKPCAFILLLIFSEEAIPNPPHGPNWTLDASCASLTRVAARASRMLFAAE
eukprot:7391385-Prymnesium_polylepis.2